MIGLGWRVWRQQPAPVAGLATAIAAAVAMTIVRPLPANMWTGLGLLALAGVVFPKARALPALPILLALPGAWLIGTSGLPGPAWVVPLVIGTVATVGPVVAWFEEGASGSAVPAVLMAISAGGVWLTVPDTEEVLVLLGAMVIPSFLAWPLRVARLGAIGAYVLVGLFLWVIAWGGRGREGSIVGAIGAFGMLVAAPIGTWLSRRRSDTSTVRRWIGLTGLHLLVVAVTTRVAGLQADALTSTGIALGALVAGLSLWVVCEKSFGHSAWSTRTEPGREITPGDV